MFDTIFGVDFSGARLAGRNTWLARIEPAGNGQRRLLMRNGGGDPLDAVLAAVGAVQAWHAADHHRIARHPRYPREGRLFV